MSKVFGYIVGVVGIILLALSIKPINVAVSASVPQISNVPTYYLLGAGIVVLLVAIILLRSSGSGKQSPEVPIYQGKNVVGFRRMGKKRRR